VKFRIRLVKVRVEIIISINEGYLGYLTSQSIWSEIEVKRNQKDFFPTKKRNFKLWKMPKLLNL